MDQRRGRGCIGRREFAALAAAASVMDPRPGRAEASPRKGGVLEIATVGEPPTLDPMESPADVVGMVSQHVFETLYTWGAGWRIVPLLAAAEPDISADGRTYLIPLRDGVRFHDGSTVTSRDVLASLERWVRIAQRGRQVAEYLEGISAPDARTVRIALKQAYAPLLPFLALQTSAAIVLPAGKQTQPMTEFVGTGPFRFTERAPDRYVRLQRFEEYASRPEPPDNYGGGRTPYVDELRFVPVPNAATRVSGALAGQYDYGDSLPVDALGRLRSGPVEPVVFKSFGWPLMFVNHKQGPLTNPALRRAVAASLSFEDMLAAAFGAPEFYALDPAFYPEGFALHSDAGADIYRAAGDPARAKAMAEQAGYKGERLRIMVSQQYDFHFKLATVAAEYMRQAGLSAELAVVDWATLLQSRTEAGAWEIFITHGPILPEPTLYSFMSPAAPGWWSGPGRDAAVAAFDGEANPQRRAALWGPVQQRIYEDVPVIRAGNFGALAVRSRRLQGLTPAVWPFFWNTWIES